MRSIAVLLVACGVLAGSPSASAGAHTVSESVKGLEYFATATHGRFAGTADGSLPGGWNIDVRHTKLCVSCSTTAKITSGRFQLATKDGAAVTLITGAFSGGTVQVLRSGAHCTNQTFAVRGLLRGVGPWHRGTGTGAFGATLTHFRRSILGRCVVYAASVTGTLKLSF
jgi:hypothetical protein